MTPAWGALAAATAADHQRLLAALARPGAVQTELLRRLLADNADTRFGRRHDFADLPDAQAFRAAVPLTDYEGLRPAIEAMLAGERGVLVAQPPLLWEETGGSSGGLKAIPYPAAALEGFARAVRPWLHDLLLHHPGVGAGRAWFAVSPAARPARMAADGTPIGAASDAIYFGADLLPALAEAVLDPPGLNRLELPAWRLATLHHLVAAEDLTLLSVWSPSFLTLLLAALPEHADPLLQLLSEGGHGLPPLPARARALGDALRADPPDTVRLWPRLALVSCWSDASSARLLPALRERLPGVAIQGKGLLATEGVVTLPLGSGGPPVLAVESAFFEFLTPQGESRLAEELETGGEYEVVMTTFGGLYRYRTGDRVAVRGHYRRTPRLEFLGRGGVVSDLCGEKLGEAFVGRALPTGEFAMLLPLLAPAPGYRLLLDADRVDDAGARRLAAEVEARLAANPQYLYARRLGQLAPLTPLRVSRPLARYLDLCRARGRRLADIKPPPLVVESDLIAALLENSA